MCICVCECFSFLLTSKQSRINKQNISVSTGSALCHVTLPKMHIFNRTRKVELLRAETTDSKNTATAVKILPIPDLASSLWRFAMQQQDVKIYSHYCFLVT